MTAPADTLDIVVAQLDPVAANVAANLALIRATRDEAARQEADLVVFPELFLSGLPLPDPSDLPALLTACAQAVDALARESAQPGSPALLVGAPWEHEGRLFDAVHLIAQGAVAATRCKVNTAVTEPAGVPFAPGPMPGPFSLKGVRIGAPVGYDLDTSDVAECLAETGAELLIVPDAAMYHRTSFETRLHHMVARVVECGLPLIHVNMVGGEQEWVFDGASVALNPDRTLAMQYPSFQPRVRMTRWERFESGWRCLQAPVAERSDGARADYEACLLALRDAMGKAGREGLLLDLTRVSDGGLGALLAVDAAGPAAVRAVTLAASPADHAAAETIAATLGLRLDHFALDAAATALSQELAPLGFGMAVSADLAAAARDVAAHGLGLLPVAPMPAPTPAAPGGYSTAPLLTFNPVKPLDAAALADLLELRTAVRPAGAKGPERVSLAGWPRPAVPAGEPGHAHGPAAGLAGLHHAIPGPRFMPRPDPDAHGSSR